MTYEYDLRFNEILEHLVKDAGITKTEMAENKLGIDRGTFLQILRGKRHCPEWILEKISKVLILSDEKHRLLMDAYDREEYGSKWKYICENRKIIDTCLNMLQRPLTKDYGDDPFGSPLIDNVISVKEGIFGGSNLRWVISAVLNKEFTQNEVPKICAFLPPSVFEFFENMKDLYHKNHGKTISFRQIIPNDNAQLEQVHRSLEYLTEMLFFSYSGCPGYEPYYCHIDVTDKNFQSLLYPYYIITSDSIIQLSADLSEGYYSENPSEVEVYRSRFERIVKKLECPLKRFPGLEAYIQRMSRMETHASEISYEVGVSPCFLTFLPMEYISGKINPRFFEDPKESSVLKQGIEVILGYKEVFQDREQRNVSIGEYFFESGLAQFVEDGIPLIYPQGLVESPVPLKERVYILEHLKNDMMHPEKSVNPHYMIKKSVMEKLAEVTVSLFDNELLIYRNLMNDFSVIKINNMETIRALKEYFTVYLRRSSKIYSIDEAIDIIDGYIVQLKQRM